MTKTTSTIWNPEEDLTLLLDALTEEILSATDRDVAPCRADKEILAKDMIQEVRRMISAADADLFAPPLSHFVGRTVRTHITRN